MKNKQEETKITTTITHRFNVGDYIWSKGWREMLACRQYKVIHITESGYILKQVDHRGRLWKETIDISKEWEENYELVPKKYIRKLEHKFNVGDKIYQVVESGENTNHMMVIEIIPDTGYKVSNFLSANIIPFKDEMLYEKIGEETTANISLEDRQVFAEAEDHYLNSVSYKLEETMSYADLKEIIKDNETKPEKYDYYKLLSGDKVLVRYHDLHEWKLDYFSHLSETGFFRHKFICVGGAYPQCIPFIPETSALLGTKNKPDDYYINW